MNIQKFKPNQNLILHSEQICTLSEQYETICIDNCAGSYDVFLVCQLFSTLAKSIVVFVPDSKYAEILSRQCASLIGEQKVSLFPSRDAIPYNMKSPFGPVIETRFRVLSQLMDGIQRLYIAPAVTLVQKMIPQKELFNRIIRINLNDEISQEILAQWLIENGFVRETAVQDIGTFAIRGGIVDIYPYLSDNPIRIEFWGDLVESIREFDIFKQKSIRPRDSITIFPMKEFCFDEETVSQVLKSIEDEFCHFPEHLTHLSKLRHKWQTQADHDGLEWFIHWFDQPFSTILDYLAEDCMIIWDDRLLIEQRLQESYHNYELHLQRVPETFLPFVTKPDILLVPNEQLTDDLTTYQRIFLNTHPNPENDVHLQLELQEQPSFNGNLRLLQEHFKKMEDDGYALYLFCETDGHAERMKESLESEHDYMSLEILLGFIEKGFIDKKNRIALYSEFQIFTYAHRPIKRKQVKSGIPIKNYDSLLTGDYVVHIDHGIARFVGIEPIQSIGKHQDCMVLAYQNNAKLYVPIQDFHKVQKYIGKDTSQPPSLSKLGSIQWERQKERTRKTLREMAENIINLYAKRKYLEGIAFSKDSVWQNELEELFIYELTPDQEAAIKEVKKDMEMVKPMDRLVCGDVGFGKTEVAIRAAFKAAIDGYQVAMLAPTTILSAQHFATFKERMAGFPIVVAVLSRFQKRNEQKEILNKLKSGNVDIVIGTHRLLSKDVTFKNLGLLIIDEEQHFGVSHKEKLKEFRYKVDVLSLTATPIPRTMHMSLIGVRDLSIINTPPKNRLPIETMVSEYHDEIVKNAIENELDRGGQVYIVHNRIKSLPQLQDVIELSVPRARVIVGHGQMDEKELELVMKEFIAGKYDVLLSTAIIESGLDISNVNTIIINRADALGLSQLYQLRGRVGRSSEQAYAYLLTKPFKQINRNSLKRLQALEQYTDLGSGFLIAMRDLEIRGAGNILGTYQHGFIAAIGFELYCRILKEEIDKIKGKGSREKGKAIKVELPVDAFIPADYIKDSSTRIMVYQEFSSCGEMKDAISIKNELADRFGPIPDSVNTLLILMQIKILGQKLDFSRIHIGTDNQLIFTLYGESENQKTIQRIKKIVSCTKYQFEIGYDTLIVIKTKLTTHKPDNQILEIRNILNDLTL